MNTNEQQLILTSLIASKYVYSFNEFEQILSSFKFVQNIILLHKVNYMHSYYPEEILEFKNLSDISKNQIVNKHRISIEYKSIGNIQIQIQYLQNITQEIKDKQAISKVLSDNWYLIVQMQYKQDQNEYQLLLYNDVNQGQLMNSTIKSTVATLKENIQELLDIGDWNQLFKKASFVEFRISSVDKFISSMNLNIQYDQLIINNLLTKILNISQIHVDILFFLSSQVYINQNKVQPDIKLLLKNPININRSVIYKSNKWENFIIAPKLDGTRALLLFYKGAIYLLFENKLDIIAENIQSINLIFETEVYENTIYIYDLHFQDKSLINLNFIQRLGYIQSVFKDIENLVISNTQYKLLVKQFIYISRDISKQPERLKQSFTRILEQKYPLDGVILNSNSPYKEQLIYKWKPREKLTIDFFVQQINPNLLNIEQINQDSVYFGLFSLISKQEFQQKSQLKTLTAQTNFDVILLIFQSEILLQPAFFERSIKDESENSINNKVAEFKYDIDTKQWQLFRIRVDKDPSQMQFGNYFTVAQKILLNILEPIQYEELYQTSTKYFEITKSSIYNDMTKYINLIKQITITNICKHKKNVLDLASGKGQDLNKYIKSGVKNLICIDNSKDALFQLSSRFNSIRQDDVIKTALTVKQLHLNDKESISYLIGLARQKNVNVVNCNLAIHYFITNNYLFDVFLRQFEGTVSFLFFNGQRIFNLLSKNPDIQVFEGDILKYQYQKKYSNNSISDVGLNIMIKLPFKTELTPEPIFNPNYLEQLMNKNGFKSLFKFNLGLDRTEGSLFQNEYIEIIKQQFNSLNSNDKFHVSLYTLYVFHK